MNDTIERAGCPLPLDYEVVTMAHGGGGRSMRELVERVFAQPFGSSAAHDGFVTDLPPGRVATTTDGFVVRPLLFPGGDIGSLAVHGTVNDLAMCGARPLHLAAAFVLEEGVELSLLELVSGSMAAACRDAGVRVVTGDTKVVERGKGDGIYITTTGIGVCEHELELHPRSIRPGDVVVLSGDVGRHGMAVMNAREGLTEEDGILSDSRELWSSVEALLAAGIELHCLRDLTRGGLAAALNELARDGGVGIEVDEQAIPVTAPVRALCELLGLDPLHVACEGRFVAVLPADQADRCLEALRGAASDLRPAVVGRVLSEGPGRVGLRTTLGTLRHLPLLGGEQLPRIC